MMGYLILIATLIISASIILIVYSIYKRRSLGFYGQKVIYSDGSLLSKILYSKTLPLKGKPDYIVKTKDAELIPVEYKSSRTPKAPHNSHIMQLAAYCVLTEENFGIKPLYGIIKYPQKEFKIPYTKDLYNNLERMVNEIYEYKSGLRGHRVPPRSNFCRSNQYAAKHYLDK